MSVWTDAETELRSRDKDRYQQYLKEYSDWEEAFRRVNGGKVMLEAVRSAKGLSILNRLLDRLEYMPDPDMALDEILEAQDIYERLREG